MPDRTLLVRLARLVARDVASGQPGENTWAATTALEGHPEAAFDLIDLAEAELRKKRPNADLISAYAYLFAHSLETIRYGIEAGRSQASALAEEIRQRLLRLGSSDGAGPELMVLLLGQFVVAKLDPGEELRAIMADLMASAGAAMTADAPVGNLDTLVEDLADELDGDVFALHERLCELTDPLPEAHRVAVAVAMLHAPVDAAREAAVGWLLSASAEVRTGVAAALGQAAAQGAVSGTMLRRMIAVRNWLPEPSRAALDQAIQSCRREGVECASWPEARIRGVLASVVDGAGAQGVFVDCRDGRRSALACLLVKHGIGVRDAWVRRRLTRAELGEFLSMAAIGMDLIAVDPAYAQAAARHALSVSLASGTMPPFAALDFLETAGLADAHPEALSAARLIEAMETGTPPSPRRLEEGSDLPDLYPVLGSWFEDGDEVQDLLAGKRMARARRVALVLDRLLPTRRQKWAELLAWTAYTLHLAESAERWEDFLAAAKAVADDGVPLSTVPLMRHVAEQTVDGFADRRAVQGTRSY